MTAQVWMAKINGNLFVAVPLYIKNEWTQMQTAGDGVYDIPTILEFHELFGYSIDVCDENDVTFGHCLKEKALRKVAKYLGEL